MSNNRPDPNRSIAHEPPRSDRADRPSAVAPPLADPTPETWYQRLPDRVRLSVEGLTTTTVPDIAALEGDYILDTVERCDDLVRWELSFPARGRLFRAVVEARSQQPDGVALAAFFEGSVRGPRWAGRGAADLGELPLLRAPGGARPEVAGAVWPVSVTLEPVVPLRPAAYAITVESPFSLMGAGGASSGDEECPTVLDVVVDEGDETCTVEDGDDRFLTPANSNWARLRAVLDSGSGDCGCDCIRWETYDGCAEAGSGSGSCCKPANLRTLEGDPCLIEIQASKVGTFCLRIVCTHDGSELWTGEIEVRHSVGPCSCPCPKKISSGPMRYADRQIVRHQSDARSTGFGHAIGHDLTVGNRMIVDKELNPHPSDIGNGFGWFPTGWAYVAKSPKSDTGLVVVRGANDSLWFERAESGDYEPLVGNHAKLLYDDVADQFRLVESSGHVTSFHGFDHDEMPSYIDEQIGPGGSSLRVTSASAGQIHEMQRTEDGVTESLTFERFPEHDDNEGRLQTMTIRRDSGAGWENVSQVVYDYYGAGESHGSRGDLRTAVTRIWNGAGWDESGTTYYRYWKAGQSGGVDHGPKYVVEPEAFARLAADPNVADPFEASDAQVALYADFHYRYASDRGVVKEHTSAGSQEFAFSVTESSHPDGFNSWKTKTVETLADGSLNIVFANHLGQTMLSVVRAGTTDTHSFTRYNDRGQPFLSASGAAVLGFDEFHADLLHEVAGHYEFLSDIQGLVEITEYYTSTGSGALEGYPSLRKIRNGQTGADITLSKTEYTTRTVGDVVVPLVSKEIVYPNAASLDGAIETTYAYTFHSGTVQVERRTTTLPAVPPSQNGTGVSATRDDVFDRFGRLIWTRDELGVISRTEYDLATGATRRRIDDVDLALVSGAPSGWSTPAGAGKHLVTDYEFDAQGRITQTLGTSHTALVDGVETTVRTARWTVYHDAQHETLSAQGYATGAGPTYAYTLINPVSISRTDRQGRPLEQIEAVRGGTPSNEAATAPVVSAGKLLATDSFPQSSYVRWTTHQFTDCCVAASTRVYHTIPASGGGNPGTHYDQTSYGYDVRKRRNLTIDPLGARTTTTFDLRGLVVATEAPLGRTTLYTYDAEHRQIAVSDPLGQRTTTIHDFRSRPLASVDSVDRRHTSTYDNLNRSPATIDPLGHRATTLYDDRGRAYARINPLGARSTSLYDAGSRTLATIDPLGQRTSSTYDSLGRPAASINPLGHRTTTLYNAAGATVASVTPLGQRSTTAYDPLGRAVGYVNPLGHSSTTRHGNAGTVVATIDPLGNRSTTIHDAAGRSVASINPLGFRSTSVYDANSRLRRSVDPLNDLTTSLYDLAGRSVATINPLGNRTTSVYDANDRLRRSVDPLGNVSTTLYDAAGQSVATIDPVGNRATSVYDANGRLRRGVDPLGNISTTLYDAAGRAVATIDPLGHRATSVYDANNRLRRSVDPLGNASTTVYDAASRAVATIDPLGNRTTSVYDANNRLRRSEDPLGNLTTSIYDAAGRSIAGVNPLGFRSTTVYDANDRVTRRVDPNNHVATTLYDAAGRTVASINPLGHRTTSVYDANNRLRRTVDALNNLTTTLYDAASRTIATIDPLGKRITSTYDAADRSVSTRNPLNQISTTVYDAAGRAVASINPLGHRATSVYDANSRLRRSVDPLGNISTTLYDDASRTIATIDPLGSRATSVYDANSRLRRSIDPLGNISTTLYDAAGRTVAAIDPLANRTTSVYDANSRLRRSVNALGYATTSLYDAAGRSVASIDPLGHRITSTYDAADRLVRTANPLNELSTTVYDAANRAVAAINPLGERSTTVYDAVNRLRRSVDPLGNISTTLYDAAGRTVATIDPLAKRTTFSFDAADRQVASRNPLDQVSTLVYDAAGRAVASIDPLGRRTTSAYDASSRLRRSVNPLGEITTTLHDAAGRNVASIDPLGHRATSVYDPNNRLRRRVDPLGNVSTTLYDPAGRTLATIDPLANRTTSAWDANNRLRRTVNALGHATTTLYDAAGRSRATIDALGGRATFSYDAAGRQVALADPLGRTTSTVYDAAGRIRALINPLNERTTHGYDAAGREITVKDPLGHVNTTIHDAAGRRVASVSPLGFRTTTVWDAGDRPVRTADPNNHIVTSVYDGVGRHVAVLNPLGHRTTTLYDAADRAIAVVDARGYRTTTVHDAAGRVRRTVNPLGQIATSAFDASGRQTLRLDPRGIRTTYAYDAAGRQTGVRYPDGTRVTTVYNAVGKRLIVQDWVGRYTRTWDPLDRIRVSKNAFGGTLTFTWDAAGQRKSLVDPLGGRTTYAYDDAGRLSVLTDPEAGRTTYTYDTAGRRSIKRLANGSRTSFSYDAEDRITAIGDFKSTGALVTAFDYAYDPAGNRSRVVNHDGDRTTWTYDAANQLAAERRSGPNSYAHTFAYDSAGNRTVLNEDGSLSTFTYDPANRLRVRDAFGSGRTTYAYDAAGNQYTVESPSNDLTTSVWSFENQNSLVEQPSGDRVTFTYNGDRMQVAREDADGLRRFQWDKHNLLLETDDAGTPLARATFEPDEYGRLVSRRDEAAGETAYYHYDALGSTAALTDQRQVVGQEYAYRAWGDEPTPAADENPYRWVGELGYRYDEDTGRHNLRRRDYEAGIARFLSEDPPEGDDDPNRYRYAKNASNQEVDPSGLYSIAGSTISSVTDQIGVVSASIQRLTSQLARLRPGSGQYASVANSLRAQRARLARLQAQLNALQQARENEEPAVAEIPPPQPAICRLPGPAASRIGVIREENRCLYYRVLWYPVSDRIGCLVPVKCKGTQVVERNGRFLQRSVIAAIVQRANEARIRPTPVFWDMLFEALGTETADDACPPPPPPAPKTDKPAPSPSCPQTAGTCPTPVAPPVSSGANATPKACFVERKFEPNIFRRLFLGEKPATIRIYYDCNNPEARDLADQELRKRDILHSLKELKDAIEVARAGTEVAIRVVLPGDDLLDVAEAGADLYKKPCKQAGMNLLIVLVLGGGGRYLNKADELGEAAGGAGKGTSKLDEVPKSGSLIPGYAERKAQRWKEYQQRGGTWKYEQWSNVYDENFTRARKANAAANCYHAKLGWGKREVPVLVNGEWRVLDIADVARRRAIEYKTGYTYLSPDVVSELERDAQLVKQGWQIEWVFEGTASQPLLDALTKARISFSFR